MTKTVNLPSIDYYRKALDINPDITIFSRYNQLRLFIIAVEHIAQELLAAIGKDTDETTFSGRVNILSADDIFPADMLNSLNNMVTWRNVAAHNAGAIRKSDIELVKTQVLALFSWYLKKCPYGPGLSISEFEELITKRTKRKVFISYASEDRLKVEELYKRLSNYGFTPWMDKRDLLPGQNWEQEIKNAIRQSDVFVACLSRNSITKRGFIQKEIRFALDVLGEIPPGRIFFIPIRLEPCDVPDFLSFLHWIDIDDELAYEKLFKAIELSTNNSITC